MAVPLSEPGVKVEAQPVAVDSRYLDCDATGAGPINQHLDEFDNLIDPSVFESHGHNDAPLQNYPRSIEATTSPGVCLAGASSCNPFPSNEAVPIESTEWPTGCIPWWPQTGSDWGSNSITDGGSWDANMSDLQGYNTREISLASPTTDPGQGEYGSSWVSGNSDWTRRKSITSERSEKGFNSKGLGPSTASRSTIDLSEDAISRDSGPRTVACISPRQPGSSRRASPRQPGSSRRASSSRHAQSQKAQPQPRSPSPPPQPKQRAQNRRAANKSRAKTKAANSELVATEKAESLKHQELSETVSGLQEEVFALKSELLQHGNCNDPIIEQYLEQRARSLAFGCRATTDLESGTLPSVANTRSV